MPPCCFLSGVWWVISNKVKVFWSKLTLKCPRAQGLMLQPTDLTASFCRQERLLPLAYSFLLQGLPSLMLYPQGYRYFRGSGQIPEGNVILVKYSMMLTSQVTFKPVGPSPAAVLYPYWAILEFSSSFSEPQTPGKPLGVVEHHSTGGRNLFFTHLLPSCLTFLLMLRWRWLGEMKETCWTISHPL